MLFSAILVSAIAAAPQLTPTDSPGYFFSSYSVLSRDIMEGRFDINIIDKGHCGQTKYVAVSPKVATVFIGKDIQNQDLTIQITKDSKNRGMKFQTKIMVTVPGATDFPNFDYTKSKDIAGMVDIKRGSLVGVLAVDVAKYLGGNTDAYAWIQVVVYDTTGETALEKHCYPIRVRRNK